MGDDVGAVLLIVVGDQPVVGRRQQLFEEPPGPPCRAAQCRAVFAVERRVAMLERQPGDVGEQRRQEPQRQDWRGQQQPARSRHCHDLSGHHGEHRRHPHALEDPAQRRRHDRAIGCDPLQQVAARHQHPDQRPDDRIEHHRALMRQHDHRQRRLAEAAEDAVALGADVLAQRNPGQAVRDGPSELRVGGKRDHHQRQGGPQRRRSREDGPGRDQQQDQRRRDQAAPQVVEDLPARDCRQPVGHDGAVGVADRAPGPARNLPVAADPPVLAGGEAQVVGRVVVDDVDVGAQRGAGERPLEEIVAEQRVVRHAPGERPLERVDVVDALADVAALVEEILIDVGHRGRVRIDADVAREDPREPRAVGADDADRDARLENSVALGHALHRRVEARPVQGVRQRADHCPAGLERQLRIAVERDDVFHRRQHAEIPELHGVAGIGGAAQQPVELEQLAALPLPSHPAPFAGVVGARAVEQEEAIRAVARVQDLDAYLRGGEQGRILRRIALGRVAEVGQQREVQVRDRGWRRSGPRDRRRAPGCARRCR